MGILYGDTANFGTSFLPYLRTIYLFIWFICIYHWWICASWESIEVLEKPTWLWLGDTESWIRIEQYWTWKHDQNDKVVICGHVPSGNLSHSEKVKISENDHLLSFIHGSLIPMIAMVIFHFAVSWLIRAVGTCGSILKVLTSSSGRMPKDAQPRMPQNGAMRQRQQDTQRCVLVNFRSANVFWLYPYSPCMEYLPTFTP